MEVNFISDAVVMGCGGKKVRLQFLSVQNTEL